MSILILFGFLAIIVDARECDSDLLFDCEDEEFTEAPAEDCSSPIEQYEKCMKDKKYSNDFKNDQLIPESLPYQRKLTGCLKSAQCSTKTVVDIFGNSVSSKSDIIKIQTGQSHNSFSIGTAEKYAKICAYDALEKLRPDIESCVAHKSAFSSWKSPEISENHTVINPPQLVGDPIRKVKDYFNKIIERGLELGVRASDPKVCKSKNSQNIASDCIRDVLAESEDKFNEIHTIRKHKERKDQFCKAQTDCNAKLSDNCQKVQRQLPPTVCNCIGEVVDEKLTQIVTDYFECIQEKSKRRIKISFDSKARNSKTSLGSEVRSKLEHSLHAYCSTINTMSGNITNPCKKSGFAPTVAEGEYGAIEVDLKDGSKGFIAFPAPKTEISEANGPKDTPFFADLNGEEANTVEKDEKTENCRRSMPIAKGIIASCTKDILASRGRTGHFDLGSNDCQCSGSQGLVRDVRSADVRRLLQLNAGGLRGQHSIEKKPLVTALSQALLNPIRALLSAVPEHTKITQWGTV